MGFFDWLRGKPREAEQFSQRWSIEDPAFAAWWMGTDAETVEAVTPYTVMGLSAVIRAVQVISTTIAGLPLRTHERQAEDRVRVPSVFDDPYPGIDGMTPFAWVETVLIHLLLWREAFLWHDKIDGQGNITVYRPVVPDAFESVKRVGGKRVFAYTDPDTNERTEVDSAQVTYIPGPSLDGVRGHPLLRPARAVFSAAIAGDKTAQAVLSRGIRIAGLVTPEKDEEIDAVEGAAILEKLRQTTLGRKNAGDIAFINRHVKLEPWQPTPIESQWHETRIDILGEIGRLFGLPPHLLNDTEKQTSWGTGVAEQNLGLARYTLMGWTSRIEQTLTRRLERDQFLEFDYKGLLQGTPAAEIGLLLQQVEGKLLLPDEARKVMNLPPLTAAQKRELAGPEPVAPVALPVAAGNVPSEPSRFAEMAAYAQMQRTNDLLVTLSERPTNGHAPPITVNVPAAAAPSVTIADGAIRNDIRVDPAPAPQVNFADGAIRSDVHVEAAPAPPPANVNFAEGAIRGGDTHIEPTRVTIEPGAVRVENPVTIADGAVRTTVEAPVSLSEGAVTLIEKKPMRTVLERDKRGRITGSREEPV